MANKICKQCNQLKDYYFFVKNSRMKDGVHYYCKKCQSDTYKNKRSYNIVPVVDLEGEVWKDVKGYESFYKVSNKGRVKGLNRNILLKSTNTFRFTKECLIIGKVNNKGYYTVSLTNYDGVYRHLFVHRLVAKAFISKIEGKDIVNHIDCNPLNNNVENLEWCTNKENSIHASKLGRLRTGSNHHLSRKVIQYDLNGIFVKTHESISLASKLIGCNASGINACCRNKYKSCSGFKWEYYE